VSKRLRPTVGESWLRRGTLPFVVKIISVEGDLVTMQYRDREPMERSMDKFLRDFRITHEEG
jgi:hypothetical protein